MKIKSLTLGCVLSFIIVSSQVSPMGIITKSKFVIESKLARITDLKQDSEKYNLLYPKYKNMYTEIVANYQGYRGDLADCVLSKNRQSLFNSCINASAENFAKSLKKFDEFDNEMNKHFEESKPIDSAAYPVDSSNVTPTKPSETKVDPILSVIAGLFNGGIQIWNNANALRNEQKKEYANKINSKDYDIKEREKLIPNPTYKKK